MSLFANAFLKRKMGVITVKDDGKLITIEGISRMALMHSIDKHWNTSVLSGKMFLPSNSSSVIIPYFFAPDVLYMIQQLYDHGKPRVPKRTLQQVMQLLLEKTWLGKVKEIKPTSIDLSGLKKFSIYKPKDYQEQFIRHYIVLTAAYSLRGYMLDSAPGTGKTMTLLYLSHILNEKGKKIFIVPKNAVERVWVDTIANILTEDSPYWSSLSNDPLTTDYKFYIVHYESLDDIVTFVKKNQRAFEGTFVGLDESHNFNRLAADRTNLYLELVKLPCIIGNVWSSGTPIQALGSECIPFLKAIDPFFEKSGVEERFRKIYGSSAKRGLDILQHRIGHLKFYVPAQDAINIEVEYIPYKVSIPNGEMFTMPVIEKDLRTYMDERMKFYTEHRAVFEQQYRKGLAAFEKTSAKRDKEYEKYKQYINVISRGYDPAAHKEEAMYCNQYELKTIIPAIDSKLGKEFKSARSVVKYVHLKVLGEALGLLTKIRSACFTEMVQHFDFPSLIDEAKKKTVIFTSYVEVVESAGKLLTDKGYSPILVYGETNKNLPALIKTFFEDPDANPLVATYQSLSTAVPLIAANRLIMINQPFREAIKTQAVARAARLGQDMNVDVFDAILDTKGVDNISTRNEEIITWSGDMVKSIMGTSNVDLDTLTLEAGDVIVNEAVDEIPIFLYHGSAFKQNELMPGYKRSGNLVKWDGGLESNEWLYATSDMDEAKLLGIGSALEKHFHTLNYRYNHEDRELVVTIGDKPVSLDDILNLEVYVYRIKGEVDDGWYFNYNLQNGITTEYKTQKTIRNNVLGCEAVDIRDVLMDWNVKIVSRGKK